MDRSLLDNSYPSSHDTALSVDEALDLIGYGPFQQRLMLLTAFSQLADATELMLMSYLTAPAVWCSTPWADVPGGQSAVQTSVFLGMLVGALSIGRLADLAGRRRGYLVSLCLTGFAGAGAAFARPLWLLVVLRFAVGAGTGAAPAALSLYAEFLPTAHRSARLLLFLLFFSLGTLLESLLAWIALTSPALGWRGLLLLSAAPSLLLLLAAPLMPESPRYHLARGQAHRAAETLRRAARANGREALLAPLLARKALVREAGAPPAAAAAGVLGELRLLLAPPLRAASALLCALFFLMAYVYYGLVLLQPLLVRFAEKADDDGPARHCDAADVSAVDFAGNIVAAAGELPARF